VTINDPIDEGITFKSKPFATFERNKLLLFIEFVYSTVQRLLMQMLTAMEK